MTHVLPATLVSRRKMGTVGRAGRYSGAGGNTSHSGASFLSPALFFTITVNPLFTVSSGKAGREIREREEQKM